MSTVFGRRLTKGVIQFVYTLIQDHAVWQNLQFWESSFFNDVEKGITSVYLAMNENNNGNSAGSTGSPIGNFPGNAGKSVLELSADEMKKWTTLDDSLKQERIIAEEKTVYSKVFDYTNRMINLLCPMELNPPRSKSGRRFHDDYEAGTLLYNCHHLTRFSSAPKMSKKSLQTKADLFNRSQNI